jgi:hypothetical protein
LLELFFALADPVVRAGLLILIIAILLILIGIYLRRKTVVTVPSITLNLSPTTSVKHGDSVDASGNVYSDGTTPAAGETVELTLTDSKGNTFPGPTVTTGPDGSYDAPFVVPGVAAGAVNVEAADTALGVTATKTFTLPR